MNEEKEMTFEQKLKKMNEIISDTGEMVLKDVSKIAGRDLTEDEKKSVMDSLKAYFVFTFLVMKAFV